MCKRLGADFNEGKAYFPDPAQSKRKIYVILDAAHMLKLVRNSFGRKHLVDGNGGIIKWGFIESLYEAQKSLP